MFRTMIFGITWIAAMPFLTAMPEEKREALGLRYAPNQIVVGIDPTHYSFTRDLLNAFGTVKTELSPIQVVVLQLDTSFTVEDATQYDTSVSRGTIRRTRLCGSYIGGPE